MNGQSPLFKVTSARLFSVLPLIVLGSAVVPLLLFKLNFVDDLSEVFIFILSNFLAFSSVLMWSLIHMQRIDRKLLETQDALRTSHNRLIQITDHVPGVVYRYRQFKDGKQKFEFMSRGALEMFGYSSAEILENFDLTWKLILPEDLPKLAETIQESYSHQTPWSHDFRIRRPDGAVRWVRGNSISEKPLEDGSLVFNGFFLDITEERNIEETKRGSREYLDKIINSVADPIFVKDREHRWTLLNDAMCSFMGRARETLLGKSDYDFFPKEEADVFWKKDEEVFRSGIENLNEERFTDAKGKQNIIMTKKALYTDPQGNCFIVGVIHDVTQLKAMEDILKTNLQEIENRNQELRNFAHVVSHDLKAPTYAVSSLAEWLWTDYAPQLDDKGRETIDLIRKKVEEVRCLINGILKYSMLDQLEEAATEVDFNTVIREVLELILIPPSIKVEIPSRLPTLRCEKTRMKEVFQNLLENAAKYMDKPEGKIRITCEDRGNEWEFRISDNGPGIDERNLEKIFHLFKAFGGKPRHESSGIGLAIVRKAVEHHGGRVWAESALGKGSVFIFTLPRKTNKLSL